MSDNINYEAAIEAAFGLAVLPSDVHRIVDASLEGMTLYRHCPDCDGNGSISVMDYQGNETEHQCERCYHGNGLVRVTP